MTAIGQVRNVLVCALVFAIAVPIAEGRDRRSRRKKTPPVAVLAVEFKGTADAGLMPLVEDGVKKGLRRAKREVISYREVSRKLSDQAGCTTVDCLNAAAGTLSVADFMRVVIEGTGDTYQITLYLLSINAEGGLVRRRRNTCEICTRSDLEDRVAATARDILTNPGDEPVQIEIASEPPGAKLYLNGEPVGEAPYQALVFADSYKVKAELPGGHEGREYLPAEQDIEVTAGSGAQRFQVELPAKPRERDPGPDPGPGPGGPDPDPRTGPADRLELPGRPYRVLKYLTATVAVGALAYGTGGLINQDKCVVDPVPPATECEDRYDTRVRTMIGFGVGAVALGATVLMFIADSSDASDRESARQAWEARQRRTQAIITPTRGGAFGAIRVTF